MGSNPAGDIYFHFEFFARAPPRSEQVNGAVANEIKHVHSPEVIVVLDPRYDLSYKALYISTCSIALTVKVIIALRLKHVPFGFSKSRSNELKRRSLCLMVKPGDASRRLLLHQ